MALLGALLRPAGLAVRALAPAIFHTSSQRPGLRLISSFAHAALRPLVALLAPRRWTTYGQEYQPSSVRRKRKFGFLARLRTRSGRRILARRLRKGRHVLAL